MMLRAASTCLALSLLLPALRAQCELGNYAPPGQASFGFGLDFDGARVISTRISDAAGPGEAFLFEGGPGAWTVVASLQPGSPTFFDGFGVAAAIDGEVAVVAAPYDSTQLMESGALYVFERSGGSWSEVAKLFPAVPIAGGHYGCSPTLDGDRLAVGMGCIGGSAASNSIEVFERGAGGWSRVAQLDSPGDRPGFGRALALDGDRLLAGSPAHPGSGTAVTPTGAAFLYERSLAGNWQLAQTILAADGAYGDAFGRVVALAGDLIAVGAPERSTLGVARAGAAYVFERIGPAFVQTRRLLASRPQALERFGSSLHTDGTRISLLSFGARELRLYQPGPAGHEFAASYRPGESTDRYRGARLAGGTLMTSLSVAPYPNSSSLRDYRVLAGARPYCDCSQRAWCRERDAGCRNSTGFGARLGACGSLSVAADDLVLTAAPVPAQQFGLLFVGAGQTRLPFGDGELCLAAGGVGLFRFPVRNSGAAGALSEGPGIGAYAQANFGAAGAIAAGSSWNFQAWFRDPGGPLCEPHVEQPLPRGFGLSNALELRFEP